MSRFPCLRDLVSFENPMKSKFEQKIRRIGSELVSLFVSRCEGVFGCGVIYWFFSGFTITCAVKTFVLCPNLKDCAD